MPVIINGSTGITNVNGSASTPAETGTDTDTGIYYGTNTVGLATNGTNALFIDASQNVGIGTSSPDYKLTIQTGDAAITLKDAGGTTRAYIGVAGAIGTAPTGALRLRSDQGGFVYGYQGTEQMRIDSSGNVGIGTSSPTAKFQVAGGIAIQGGGYPTSGYGWEIYNADASNNYLQSYNRTSSAYLNSVYNALTHQFYISGSERARIDSSGNLLVGTTATSNITKLTTYSAGNAFITANTNTSNLSTPSMQVSKGDNNTTTSNVLVQFLVNGFANGSGQINANGANAAAFGSFSDSRLKQNIVDLPSQLANIMALRPVEFDYIESEGGGHQIGFVAQEVKEIYPDLVGEREDGMFTLSDLNKNDARLIKAIQELKALVDTQASTITALTARIEALETK